MTNLRQTIETSMHRDQFLGILAHSERTAEMLMHKTIARITAEFKSTLQVTEYLYQPDFAHAIQLIAELDEYGFKAEAKSLTVELADLIAECYPQCAPWLRLQINALGYVLPESIRTISPSSFKGGRIFIEEHHVSGAIMHFTFCFKGRENSDEPGWTDSAVLVQDLIDFAIERGLLHGESNTVDHTGEHVQTETFIPSEIYIQEFTQSLIEDYVMAGKEIVVL